jgi:hypothetical protein
MADRPAARAVAMAAFVLGARLAGVFVWGAAIRTVGGVRVFVGCWVFMGDGVVPVIVMKLRHMVSIGVATSPSTVR